MSQLKTLAYSVLAHATHPKLATLVAERCLSARLEIASVVRIILCDLTSLGNFFTPLVFGLRQALPASVKLALLHQACQPFGAAFFA